MSQQTFECLRSDNLIRCLIFLQVLGYNLLLTLKTPNWVEQAKEEIGLCSTNTVPLYVPAQPEYNCKL